MWHMPSVHNMLEETLAASAAMHVIGSVPKTDLCHQTDEYGPVLGCDMQGQLWDPVLSLYEFNSQQVDLNSR